MSPCQKEKGEGEERERASEMDASGDICTREPGASKPWRTLLLVRKELKPSHKPEVPSPSTPRLPGALCLWLGVLIFRAGKRLCPPRSSATYWKDTEVAQRTEGSASAADRQKPGQPGPSFYNTVARMLLLLPLPLGPVFTFRFQIPKRF